MICFFFMKDENIEFYAPTTGPMVPEIVVSELSLRILLYTPFKQKILGRIPTSCSYSVALNSWIKFAKAQRLN